MEVSPRDVNAVRQWPETLAGNARTRRIVRVLKCDNATQRLRDASPAIKPATMPPESNDGGTPGPGTVNWPA